MTFQSRIRTLRLLAAGALMLVAGTALAFSSNPPNARTGAPGESTCIACHSTFPLNSGSGELTLSGFPAEYEPGASYDVTLTLSDPDAARWGFSLTLIDAAGDAAGSFTVTDSGTQLSSSGGRDYLKQNSAGTYPGTSGSASWDFTWTAPAADTGDLALYVAGNGANNNSSTSGDRIYATSFATAEMTGVGVGDTPLAFQLLGNAPNPFNPSTQIRFDLRRDTNVRVVVFAADGRRVATLADGFMGTGPQSVTWDGRDHTGRSMGSGTYIYMVDADGERQMGSMTLLK